MKQGKLYYDGNLGRYDILFEDGSEYGGLHCGDCFEVQLLKSASGWIPTRIEYDHGDDGGEVGWYLTGLENSPDYICFQGIPVRM